MGKSKIQQYTKDDHTFRVFFLLSEERLRFMTHNDKKPHICANAEEDR